MPWKCSSAAAVLSDFPGNSGYRVRDQNHRFRGGSAMMNKSVSGKQFLTLLTIGVQRSLSIEQICHGFAVKFRLLI